jgi:BNR repeat-like domain
MPITIKNSVINGGRIGALYSSPIFSGFTTPTRMNGSSSYASINAIAVNSSGKFVAVGSDAINAPLYATSNDGSTWTTPTRMDGYSSYAIMTGIAVNSSGLFVAVGEIYDGSKFIPIYATSTNGSNWTTPAAAFSGTGAHQGTVPRSVAVNSSGLFVAVAQGGNDGYAYTLTSTDGSTWTTPTRIDGYMLLSSYNCIAVNSSGKFVVIGDDLNQTPLYSTSTNGSTWTTPASMNGSPNTLLRAIAVNSSGLFVAVGFDLSTGGPKYATSTDGSTWTTPALMNGSSSYAEMTGIAVNSSGLFVAVGNDNTHAPLYATSNDGSTWTTPALMNGSSSYAYMRGITVNSSGKFVAVGVDNTNAPLYATSL